MRFSVGEGGKMDEYLKFLMDIDGGKKSEKEATVDVSKYLRFCCSCHNWDTSWMPPGSSLT